MKRSLFTAFFLLTVSLASFAGELECKGRYQNLPLVLKGKAPGILINFAKGSLVYDNTELATFEGSEMDWTLEDKSFRFKNEQNDVVEGRFDNYAAGLVTISKLSIPGRIQASNVKVKCKVL